MKKILHGIVLALCVAGLCLSCATPGSGTRASDHRYKNFRYRIEGSGADQSVTITGYTRKSKKVTIPAEIRGLPVTRIGDSAFRGHNLTSVTIPEGVTSIGDKAFWYNRLISVTIPASVTSIGYEAFAANKLTSVTISEGVTSIGGIQAFSRNQLTSVTIPASVTSIGDGAFSDNKLTSVTISEGVTSIGIQAFRANQLTSVTIPASVTSIHGTAFYSNPLKTFTIDPGNTAFIGIDGVLFTKDRKTLVVYWLPASSYVIPEGVTSIADWAFYDNELTSITIPASVTSIGRSAFWCNNLTSISIPASVTSIGYAAFSGNPLASVTFGGSVGAVKYGSFDNDLDELYIMGGRQAGTYSYQGGKWNVNGTALQFPNGPVKYTGTIGDSNIYWDRAFEHAKAGRYDAASIAFGKACNVKMEAPPGYHLLDGAYLNKYLAVRNAAYCELLIGDYDQVVSDSRFLIAADDSHLKKDSPQVKKEVIYWGYYLRGRAYIKKEEYGKAIEDFTSAIQYDPDDLDTYYWRGIAYTDAKDYDKARADQSYITQKDPNYVWAEQLLRLIEINELIDSYKKE